MQIVSLLAPIRCGVYQFHRVLSRGLASRGYSITWLCSGAPHQRLLAAGEADAQATEGEVIAAHTGAIVERTKALVGRVLELSPAIVLCHALGDQIDFNVARYLPTCIPRILVMHCSSLASYRSARAVREHVSATVAISPRIEEDLVSAYGFRGHRVKLIPNGVDTTCFSPIALSDHSGGRLRILSHGRIDKASKGVFWLPEVLSEFAGHAREWELTVSGDGPDLPELKRRFAAAGLAEQVQYLGWTDPERVPVLMNSHDVLLFPSRYEGFPTVLIEAMAGGCVPVASLLPGVTNFIIEDGISGLLFPVGNIKRAARHLLDLYNDRNRLTAIRKQAREAASRFSVERMLDGYDELFQDVLAQPGHIAPAEPIEKCSLAPGLQPGWWFGLPEPLKNRLRGARELVRTHISVP